MTAFAIKIIAITTMVIDHVGLFFFPDQIAFRVIGRFSFPLFAWLIANGARHTKNINAYLVRLFVFALISQFPFHFAHKLIIPDFFALNIFFTLFLGLVGIKIVRGGNKNFVKVTGVCLLALLAQVTLSDYGATGVLSIVFFYLFFDNFKLVLLSQTFAHLVVWCFFAFIKPGEVNFISFIQPLALYSLAIIPYYNGKQRPKAKYLFYVFYPAHFVVLYAVRVFLYG